METNVDFKKIWNTQKIETLKVDILYAKVNKLRNRNFLKLILTNGILLLTITFIGFIWYYYQPELRTTKVGVLLTILAMIIFVLPLNKQFYFLTKNKIEPSSKEYLKQLVKIKELQIFQQTTMLSVYFIMLSLGIGLYIFEYVSKMTITRGVIAYALTIVWIAINWFYVRPKTIAKQNEKLNKLLVEFEKLNNQMKD